MDELFKYQFAAIVLSSIGVFCIWRFIVIIFYYIRFYAHIKKYHPKRYRELYGDVVVPKQSLETQKRLAEYSKSNLDEDDKIIREWKAYWRSKKWMLIYVYFAIGIPSIVVANSLFKMIAAGRFG